MEHLVSRRMSPIITSEGENISRYDDIHFRRRIKTRNRSIIDKINGSSSRSSRRMYISFVVVLAATTCLATTTCALAFPILQQQQQRRFLQQQQQRLVPLRFSSSSSLCKGRFCNNRWLKKNHQRVSSSPSSSVLAAALEDDNGTPSDEPEWQALLDALQLYKTAYGDLKVPSRFVVPSLAPWPKNAFGVKLGLRVAQIRSEGKYVDNNKKRRQILDEMGFVWRLRAGRPKEDPGVAIDISFEQVYDALVEYRTHIQPGNEPLSVPASFVVPDCDPWSERIRGLPLGRKLASMRTDSFLQENPEQAEKLVRLGIQLRAKTSGGGASADISFQDVYDALVEYRTNIQPGNEPLNVPASFIVPDSDEWSENLHGMTLGRKLSSMRAKSYLRENPEQVEKLVRVGFQPSAKLAANDERFQKVYEALQRYKEIYGDLFVPQPFVVPENSSVWPKETWGLRLGARVNAIRSQGTFVNTNPERKVLLNNLGFVWSPPKSEAGKRRGRRRNDEIQAMEDLEEKFSAESAAKIGINGPSSSSISELASPQDAPPAIDSLFGSSFDFGADSSDGGKESLPLNIGQDGQFGSPVWGLEGGKYLQDQRRAEEEAQAAEEWKPPQTFGESLAKATEKAKEVDIVDYVTDQGRVIKKKKQKFIPWFNDDFGDEFVFEDVVEALTIYKSIYGDFSNITDEYDSFIVPSPGGEDGDLEFDDDMDEDGFGFDSGGGGMFNTDAATRAAAALEMQRSEETETALVARDTAKAPAGEWPEHLAGMRVGNIVQRIRDGSLEVKHLPERKAQLDAIDFDWGDPMKFLDVPFEKSMCAMLAYYLVRGDMFVREDFVMPDVDPWPEVFAGYELGKVVKRIRELQNFFETYHDEKVKLLRMIDFAWFPTMALPLDPNEPALTDEMENVYARGHPDYANMPMIPVDFYEKVTAEGPQYDVKDNDLKNWWRKYHNWDFVSDYWYQRGRRDNAFYLRVNGYNRMADEHEAKYGPGLFTQIIETINKMDNIGNKTANILKQTTAQERKELVEKMTFFIEELQEQTDYDDEEVYVWELSMQDHIESIEFADRTAEVQEERAERKKRLNSKDVDTEESEYEYEEGDLEEYEEEYEDNEEYEYEEYEEEEEEEVKAEKEEAEEEEEEGDEEEWEYEEYEYEYEEGEEGEGGEGEEEEEEFDVEDELGLGKK